MAVTFIYRYKQKSLNAQIRAAERQLAHRQRLVADSSSCLIQHLRQRMTAPATLLLGGGIGFILGELTKRQKLHTCSEKEQFLVTETTAWNIALDFINLIHNLYLSLPLILLIKSSFESGILSEAPDYRNAPPAGDLGLVDSDREKHR